jgi:uncharacterized protein YdhG (YjbR/CyaY superfamily)
MIPVKNQLLDQYINDKSSDIQHLIHEIRKIIFLKAPLVDEGFSYGMPAYKLNGKPLLYFGVFKNHLGVYALPAAHATFAEKLQGFKQSKGAVQFPFHQEMPFDLISELIDLRINQMTIE